MTRKDYIVIATALRESIDEGYRERGRIARIEAEAVACKVAEYLSDNYPNFNSERFLDACSIERI